MSMHTKYEVSFSYISKLWPMFKVFFCARESQMDRTKPRCLKIPFQGHKYHTRYLGVFFICFFVFFFFVEFEFNNISASGVYSDWTY